MDEIQNPDVSMLQTLCDKAGGFRAVAKAIDVNDQSLYQILTGVKLKSGRPKGIGPALRDKLNIRFPGWNVSDQDASNYPITASEMATKLAAAYDRIPKNDPVRLARAFSAAFAAIEKELVSGPSTR